MDIRFVSASWGVAGIFGHAFEGDPSPLFAAVFAPAALPLPPQNLLLYSGPGPWSHPICLRLPSKGRSPRTTAKSLVQNFGLRPQ